MTNFVATGLPVIAFAVGFVVVGSIPVWFGAQITGAGKPTLVRSALSLILGIIGSGLGGVAGMPLALLIAPLSFLFAFKFILDTSFFGALLLCIVAVIGYFLMGKFIGGGFSVNEEKTAYQKLNRPALVLVSPMEYAMPKMVRNANFAGTDIGAS
jgi:hypothetical protein